LSSPLLFGSELLGELILLLSTSTTATIVEPSIHSGVALPHLACPQKPWHLPPT